jgi:hypothetical protein
LGDKSMKYLQRIIARDKFYDGGKKLMGFLKRLFKGHAA